ncbi:outer membrane protein [Bradyrhizobium sp.]|uniref:outer membrane protein n=1 Tax=Bradyrhizobium sp. TaxID=376 RepID=UPI003C52CC10
MKRIALIALATAGLAGPALAADLPGGYFTKAPPMVAAIYNWGGVYVGANAGWSGDSSCWGLVRNGAANVALGCSRSNGVVAGGQLGYRWQADAFVFGVEAQGDWAGLKSSNISLANSLVTNQSKINGLGLFTAQAGYAFNNVLLYVKGGGAIAADEYNGFGTATGVAFDHASESRWGGVAGAGVEYGFLPNWSVAVEYDHLFMGNASNNFFSTGLGAANTVPAGGLERVVNIHQDLDMVTARINYHWGAPAISRY